MVFVPTAFVVWQDLKQHFNQVDGTRVYQLHREISLARQGSLSIKMFFSKLKLIWDKYESIVAMMFDSSAFAEFLDTHKLFQFLFGMNDTYIHC